jgi:hypothetical protein
MLFTYSRPEHTRSVLKALGNNDIAKETNVYAYTCEPKNDGHAAKVDETKRVLAEYQNSDLFQNFEIVDFGKYMPLGPAMIAAVNDVISAHGRIIVVEDDIVTSKDFLSFMNDCLNYYETDKTVFSISGYSPDMPEIRGMTEDVYMVHRACPWGWGTWSSRWDSYDPYVKEYVNNILNREYRRSIAKWNTDLPMTLDALFFEEGCMDKNWEQQFCFCQFVNRMNVVCPKLSKVRNIGFDGTGANPAPIGLESSFDGNGAAWKLEHTELNESFQKRYNKQFIFRSRTKFFIALSNIIHFISPGLYYRLLNKFYHTDVKIKDLQNYELDH